MSSQKVVRLVGYELPLINLCWLFPASSLSLRWLKMASRRLCSITFLWTEIRLTGLLKDDRVHPCSDTDQLPQHSWIHPSDPTDLYTSSCIPLLNCIFIYCWQDFVSTSAFPMPSVTWSPSPVSTGPTFSLAFLLLLVYLQKSCHLFPLASCSYRWALPFLTFSVHTWAVSQIVKTQLKFRDTECNYQSLNLAIM